jgi:hypothetical protein
MYYCEWASRFHFVDHEFGEILREVFMVVVGTLILAITHSIGAHLDDNAEAETVVRRCQGVFQQLQSCEFHYSYTSSLGGNSNAILLLDGARFRMEREDITADEYVKGEPGKVQTETVAYDVKQFQTFDRIGDRLMLFDGGENEDFGVRLDVPIFRVFMWLFQRGDPYRLDSLFSDKNWSLVADSAKIVGRRTLLDTEVIGVRIPHHNASFDGQFVLDVWLAPSFSYSPLLVERVSTVTGNCVSSAQVAEFQEMDLNGNKIAFPTKVIVDDPGTDGRSMRMRFTMVVDRESVRLNPVLSDSVFTLSGTSNTKVVDVSEAQRIRDVRSNELASNPAHRPVPRDSFSASQVSLALFFVAMCGIGFSVYRLVKR